LVGLGFEHKASHLQSRWSQRRSSTAWATPPVHFIPFFCFYFLFFWRWGLSICLGWPWTIVLMISAS
jgi:hypothetical protein